MVWRFGQVERLGQPGTANTHALDTTRRQGAREREPGPAAGAARDTAPASAALRRRAPRPAGSLGLRPRAAPEPGTANGRALDTTRRRGAREREPGPGSSPARANGAPQVGQGPADVP